MNIERVDPRTPEQMDLAARVLVAAFRDYSVMRYVVGDAEDYDERLFTLIRFFVSVRDARDETILFCRAGDQVVGCALLSNPGSGVSPDLTEAKAKVWGTLGDSVKARYEEFGAAADYPFGEAHLHLNMIGVLPEFAGQGIGRALLEHVHSIAEESGSFRGVSLSTEKAGNVGLYEHFGYEVIAQSTFGDGLESWGMFRPNP